MLPRNWNRVTLLIATALSAGTALASDPVAVYARIDRVVMEPDRIQIWGEFSIAKVNDQNYYEAPQNGYLYLSLPSDKQEQARKEWADFKSIAGSRQVVAFGSRFQSKNKAARVRGAGEKAESPDTYEVAVGITKVRSDTEYGPIKALLQNR